MQNDIRALIARRVDVYQINDAFAYQVDRVEAARMLASGKLQAFRDKKTHKIYALRFIHGRAERAGYSGRGSITPKRTVYTHENYTNPPRVYAHRPIGRIERRAFVAGVLQCADKTLKAHLELVLAHDVTSERVEQFLRNLGLHPHEEAAAA